MPGAPSDPPRRSVQVAGHTVVYTDAGGSSSDGSGAIVVGVHGAPGSTWDWRWLGAAIEGAGCRMIRLDLPGHGGSSEGAVAGPSAAAMADAVWDTLAALPGVTPASRFVFVGHSLGIDTVLTLAAKRHAATAGVALVNPVGLRPHHAIRPWWFVSAIARALERPVGVALLARPLWLLFTAGYGFPRRTSVAEVVWCQRRVGARDFDALRVAADAVAGARIPSLLAYATDDALVEPAVPQELAAVLRPTRTLRFAHGGHYLQKEHAAALGREIVALARGAPPYTPPSRLH